MKIRLAEKKIILYTALFIALIVNLPRLLALREAGLVAKYWAFNPAEFFFQLTYNFFFCWLIAYLLLRMPEYLKTESKISKYIKQITLVAFLYFTFTLTGIVIQKFIFNNHTTDFIFFGGYFTRMGISVFLVVVAVRIILLLLEIKKSESENEQLRNAYLNAQLELLKEQLNPHFFFNALSSLSAVVRENPPMAQHYISQLSKVYRYALQKEGNTLVPLEEELLVLQSYSELLKMRHEEGFNLLIDVEEKYLNSKLPHMSLQPLIENAIKHNSASVSKPLYVKLTINNHKLIFSNNLQQINYPEPSTGIGLTNLNERYKIVMHKEIDILQTTTEFIIKLPLD